MRVCTMSAACCFLFWVRLSAQWISFRGVTLCFFISIWALCSYPTFPLHSISPGKSPWFLGVHAPAICYRLGQCHQAGVHSRSCWGPDIHCILFDDRYTATSCMRRFCAIGFGKNKIEKYGQHMLWKSLLFDYTGLWNPAIRDRCRRSGEIVLWTRRLQTWKKWIGLSSLHVPRLRNAKNPF